MGLKDRVAERFGYMNSEAIGRMVADGIEAKMSDWSNVIMRAWNYDDTGDDIKEPYKQHVWVYKCVRKRAESLSSIGVFFTRRGTDSVVTDHALIRLLMKPNAYMNGHEFIEGISTWIDLKGEAFAIPMESAGQAAGISRIPAALFLLNPAFVDEIKGNPQVPEMLTGWSFNQRFSWPVDEVTQWKQFNPYSLYRGFSPLTVARMSANADHKANLYNDAFFDNNGVPGTTLTTDQKLTEHV